ncbi:hypothetical protein BV898_03918 [Hypsibius exemplaris]|nr:hypothetical protein BV898_03918 [Hypsibius exemplaris]
MQRHRLVRETYPTEVVIRFRSPLKRSVILGDGMTKKSGTAVKKRLPLLVNGTIVSIGHSVCFSSTSTANCSASSGPTRRSPSPTPTPNTAASHPSRAEELDEADVVGVTACGSTKTANRARIAPEQVPLDGAAVFDRIHYRAPSDETWASTRLTTSLPAARVDLKPNRTKSSR